MEQGYKLMLKLFIYDKLNYKYLLDNQVTTK